MDFNIAREIINTLLRDGLLSERELEAIRTVSDIDNQIPCHCEQCSYRDHRSMGGYQDVCELHCSPIRDIHGFCSWGKPRNNNFICFDCKHCEVKLNTHTLQSEIRCRKRDQNLTYITRCESYQKRNVFL